MTTITALGLGLIWASVPLQMHSQQAHHELLEQCRFGARTAPLYAYYSVLLNIRKRPDCIMQATVEQCDGFQERFPYTGFLKHLELTYACSGFCYQNVTGPPPKYSTVTVIHKMIKKNGWRVHRLNPLVQNALKKLHIPTGLKIPPGLKVPPVPVALMETGEASEANSTVSASQGNSELAKRNLKEALERRRAKRTGRSGHAKGMSLLETDHDPETFEANMTESELEAEDFSDDTAELGAEDSAEEEDGPVHNAMANHMMGNAKSFDHGAPPAGIPSKQSTPAPLWDHNFRNHEYGNTIHNMWPLGWQDEYPPTLFTTANYKQTCEGAAARELLFTGVETGNLIYMEGLALFITSGVVGFLKIMSMCKKRTDDDRKTTV